MMSFTNIAKGSDLDVLAAVLNDSWNTKVDAATMRLRLSSGLPFVIAYDDATVEDCECLRSLGLTVGSRIPVGILETIDLISRGSYANVPLTYDALTNNGKWRKKLDGSDTLIFVDVTLLPSRRGKDTGRMLMSYALVYLAKNTGHSYFWTYTPDIEKVKRWHEGFGAIYSHHVIQNARPFFRVPSVSLMDYSHYVDSLRK